MSLTTTRPTPPLRPGHIRLRDVLNVLAVITALVVINITAHFSQLAAVTATVPVGVAILLAIASWTAGSSCSTVRTSPTDPVSPGAAGSGSGEATGPDDGAASSGSATLPPPPTPSAQAARTMVTAVTAATAAARPEYLMWP